MGLAGSKSNHGATPVFDALSLLIDRLHDATMARALDRLSAALDAAAGRSPRVGERLHPSRLRAGVLGAALLAVLSDSKGPMRRRDIHLAIEDVIGQPVALSSLKTALTREERFDRVEPGWFQLGAPAPTSEGRTAPNSRTDQSQRA
jgi:hypothetical protein